MVRATSIFVVASALALGCASSSDVGSSKAATDYASAQADWSQFPDGYQCMVAVQIFYPAAFNVQTGVAGNFWSGDCAPVGACHIWYDDVPDSNVWERIPNDGTQSPSMYDMIVFGPTSSNEYGHIASVDHVDSAGNVFVMDDNYNSDQRKASEPHTVWRPALGWYHIRSLPKNGPSGGGSGSAGYCPNDGMYCGGDYIGGDPNTLYQCSNHSLYVSQVCASGCEWMPVNVDDQCKSAPPPSTWCPNDGLYCGGDVIQGDANTLYQCSAHALSVYEVCSSGCAVMPEYSNDYCY